MFKRLVSALLLLPALCSINSPVFAGYDMTRSTLGVGRCYPETAPGWNPNITYCQGTMAGIRYQSGDPSRYAYFSLGSNGSGNFTMMLNNTGYSCTAPASMRDLWLTAMSTNGWFSIAFDRTTGVCTALTVSGGSHMKAYL